jgi:hypothetical protein
MSDFYITGVVPEIVEKKYGITNYMLDDDKKHTPENITKLSDIHDDSKLVYNFLDEAKINHKCNISMIDHDNKIQHSNKLYCCFWCRQFIPKHIKGIGCPIEYVHNIHEKKYYSNITKQIYTIKEAISAKKPDNLTSIKHDYYISDGIFCSFNCCMAYIYDNRDKEMYALSEMLLLKIYNTIYPDNNLSTIKRAPAWRLLRCYGGHLSYIEFKESFKNIEYRYHGIIKKCPTFSSICQLYEKKINFT